MFTRGLRVSMVLGVAALFAGASAWAVPVHYHFDGRSGYNKQLADGPVLNEADASFDLDFSAPLISPFALSSQGLVGHCSATPPFVCVNLLFTPGDSFDRIRLEFGTADLTITSIFTFASSAFDIAGTYTSFENFVKAPPGTPAGVLITTIGGGTGGGSTVPMPVPEPASAALLLIGVGGLAACRRRHRWGLTPRHSSLLHRPRDRH